MLNVGSLKEGVVLDHIQAGRSMSIYHDLGLDKLDCSVAIIKNARSNKMGRKDIIKIDAAIDLDMDILGYVDPDATVDVIRNGNLAEKRSIALPERLRNVICCRNPRCITTTEQELPQIFKLTDREQRIYRCVYCEAKAQ